MIKGEKTNELVYTITEEDAGKKLLDILIKHLRLSSRLVKKSKSEKKISLNGIRGISVNCTIRKGDTIKIEMKHETNHFESEDIPIDVLYEDADMLIINKQPYVVVHPTRGHPTGTIANGLAKYFEDKGIYDKIRFINRLDRDTSGILLIAKNGFGQQAVSNQMRANKVKKLYTTVVKGHMECESGEISTPIGRPSEDSVKRDVLPVEMGGQSSLTLYRVVERLKDHDVLEVELITGRTHQIRVHLSSIGHPIVGDELYGGETDRLDRQALHCSEMVLKSARGSDTILVNAELPADITKIIDELR